MAFFGFTLGAAGPSGSVATAVAAGVAAALDAGAAGADVGVAGGFAAGAGVVAGAFATGAAGVSVDEVAAAGGVEAGACRCFRRGLQLRRSFRCVFVWNQFAPLFIALNHDNSNPTTPRNQATSAALAQHGLEPAFPARREQRFDHAAGCGGKILGVAVPPRFRKSR